MADTLARPAEEQEERKHTGIMHHVNETGDVKILWDAENEDEVAAARAAFDELTGKKGFAAFTVKGRRGDKGDKIDAFDPAAERIILVPQIVGG